MQVYGTIQVMPDMYFSPCLGTFIYPPFLCISSLFRSGGDALINVRCIKSCHPHDISCNIKSVHTITHTSLSLPTFRDFHEPEEIVFLRTVTAANSAVPGATDVFFDIQYADDQLSFDVEKRTHHGTIVGVVRQVKPIIGPRDLVIEVAMNYIKSRTVSHRNIVIIHVFISELWF
ncbi:hypothetical protein JOQ06_003831 [Pogonophryne albipinna]|uniref:Fibulin C-terminal Ig-like domain-containing protein n=1 Tax=Pogonophryne albipinna TaxID=1090488 RepID=A0AAD6F826_9TELE|nr:hypothetical protein JOQ06_003831 [Pogonophryne albipinna]